jgi:hypothetical protein
MKHNKTCVTFQKTFNEIKLRSEKTKISQIDFTIYAHGDTNALSRNIVTKTNKQIVQEEIQPRDQV